MNILGRTKQEGELKPRSVDSRRRGQPEQRANTYQYYRQNDPAPDSTQGRQLVRRQRRMLVARILRGKRGFVFVVGLLFVLAWAGSISNVAVNTIVSGEVGEADPRDAKAVQRITNSGGLRNRYILSLNKEEASAQIRDKRPDILAVDYAFSPFRGTLRVSLIQSPTVLIVQSKTNYALLNIDGVVSQIRQEPPTADEIRVYPLLIDDNSLPMETGKVGISKDIVTFIRDLEKAAQLKSLETHTYSLPAVPREVRVKFADSKYYIKLSATQPASQQLQALVDIRNYLTKNNITPSEYVDLRIPEKAYYR